MVQSRAHLKLTAVFALLSILWGSEFVAIKFGLSTSPPLIFAGLRYFLAGVGMFLAIASRRRFDFSNIRQIFVPLLLGVLAAAEFGFLYLGTQYVGAGMSSILFNTQPIMVGVLAIIFLKEPLTWKKSFATGVGFLGTVLVFLKDVSSAEISLGGLLVLLSALSYALGTIVFKKLVRGENLSSLTSILLTTSGGLLLVSGVLFESTSSFVISTVFILILTYLMFVSVTGITVWFYLLKRYEASLVSPYLFLVPAFGVLQGWLILSEKVDLPEVIGLFCIGLTIYILNK